MKKTVALGLLAGLLALAGPAAAQTMKLPPGSLRWSAERPLTVADFKARPRPTETHAALTSTNINTGASCRDDELRGTARASFDPASSWVRDPATITPALLRHEQLHFDITEVFARRLRQQLALVHLPCDQMSHVLERLSQAEYAAWQVAEDAYDRDTRHGLDHEQQARWEQLVQQQLADLAKFAEENS